MNCRRLVFLLQRYLFVCGLLCVQVLFPEAEWSILVYIQGDSNLAPFAEVNLQAMERGVYPNNEINILVQMDLPQTDRAIRLKINPFQREDLHFDDLPEMGCYPKIELINAVQWMRDDYPARHYAIVLWNHGGGIVDELPSGFTDQVRRGLTEKMWNGWLEIPGMAAAAQCSFSDRGILYDYTQGTYLSSVGLREAMIEIKRILGKKVDLLGMDACFMGMIEVAYQIRDCAEIFVGSEDLEPGDGWNYEPPFRLLTREPGREVLAEELACTIVKAYGDYYRETSEVYFTQSALKLSSCDLVKNALDDVVRALDECWKINQTLTKKQLLDAWNTVKIYIDPRFCDLVDWLDLVQAKIVPSLNTSKTWKKAALEVHNAIDKLKEYIRQMILCNEVGSGAGNSHGVSIFYPSVARIIEPYKKTEFIKDSLWLSLIQRQLSA